MTAEIHTLNRGAFIRELLEARRSPAPRYDLRTWAHGYAIYENDEVVATIHGPNIELASRLLRMLREGVS